MRKRENVEQRQSTKQLLEMKRMECSIMLWFGIIFVIVALLYVFAFSTKQDNVNRDTYDLVLDAIDSNPLNNLRYNNFSNMRFYFQPLGSDVQTYFYVQSHAPVNGRNKSDIISIVQGNIFGAISSSLSNSSHYFYHINVYATEYTTTSSSSSADFYVKSANDDLTFFSFPLYIRRGLQANGTCMEQPLSSIHLIYYEYEDISGFSYDRVEYGREVQCGRGSSSSPMIIIHDASEPVTYEAPPVRYMSLIYLWFVLAILSVFMMLFFIWHCWSVRFILIKKAIYESGLTFQNRYSVK